MLKLEKGTLGKGLVIVPTINSGNFSFGIRGQLGCKKTFKLYILIKFLNKAIIKINLRLKN